MTFPVLSANGPSGYNLTNSLRFRASASAYLNRTPASASNRKTWTWSGWVKLGALSANGTLFAARTGVGATYLTVGLSSLGDFRMESDSETAYPLYKTNALFRDPSAWYHFVIALDMTQATSTNRLNVWVNGVLQTTASYNVPAQNTDLAVNSTETHLIGQQASSKYFDGYMAEVNFIDGQALTPSSFGSTNAVTGVWQPAKYTGTYGTNGFYLPFTNTTSTTTLGNDFSGNGNNWTTNNISLTSGATYDAMTDVPTLTSATAANYAVMNPLALTNLVGTFSNGNLQVSKVAAYPEGVSTQPVNGGKFYAETTITAQSGQYIIVGVVQNPSSVAGAIAPFRHSPCVGYRTDGQKNIDVSYSAYGASFTTNDVIGIAVDVPSNSITFYKNGVSQGAISYTFTSANWFVGCGGTGTAGGGSDTVVFNFGQRPFAYTPPSGFVALNTFNLPSSTIPNGANFMAADIYTGNGSSQTRTLNFQPDFIWNKIRSQAYDHNLFDVLRGVDKRLISNLTSQELTITNALTAFNSNGYSVGNYVSINGSGESIVNWAWKAGGAGVTNTAGSITSTVSANTTSGFSVVTFTAQASGTGTIGHGLGVAPAMIITKQRATAGTSWTTYHASVGNTAYLVLNTTAASATLSTAWNNTSPTSSVFSLGSAFAGASTMVAYCFAPIAGFSAFGSYTGNGSTDGPFVYTGFRPRWILIKENADRNWQLIDSARLGYNGATNPLSPNTSGAEPGAAERVDFLSNGFKPRTSAADFNTSSGTYIYACFAENPFKNALAR